MDPSSYSVVSLDVQPDDSTLLDLRVNDQWVHIDVQRGDLKNEKVSRQYTSLLKTYRRQQEDEEPESEQNTPITGATSRDSGYSSGDDAKTAKAKEEDVQESDDENGLQNWMIDALDSVRSDFSRSERSGTSRSLVEWYNTTTHCYNIVTEGRSENIIAVRRDDLDGEDYVQKYLTPRVDLPKYLRNLKNVSWYKPEEVQVEDEADDIHLSAHPTLVSIRSDAVPSELLEQPVSTSSGQASEKKEQKDAKSSTAPSSSDSNRTTFFLKLATPLDARSVKREIRFLHLLQKHDLYSKGIRAPRLAGLVSLPSPPSTTPPTHLLGFLLTLIPQPSTPLTHFMSPSVPSSHRSQYAAESASMVSILHRHDLVWGDAKADNFLVDACGELWMIDFGGSFTPGWVDEELADTVDGDDMGTEKIVKGLEDPERWVEGEGDKEGTRDGGEKGDADAAVVRARGVARTSADRSVHIEGKKRKRSEEGEDGDCRPSHVRKRADSAKDSPTEKST
ncbi:MAG: hypothetical protein Q9160_008550 [Pyrenula sp. 1 TL-2023]